MARERADQAPIERCPHCGRDLSSWERVLLQVDRALVCKSCWYRIILPVDAERDADEKERKR
ncbi:MAG: hypothetical protein GF419_11915 [Ignavibacteriales bacterium]|jgi:DNA-directed RNA polymerase subunit RPC12/RpoP|nr:hypothetical protein [Ignavibacteriales bacterium]